MKRTAEDSRYTAMLKRLADTGRCDCGHSPEPREPDSCTSGYGIDGDTMQSRCYACCAEVELDFMREKGRNTLYLVHTWREGEEPLYSRTNRNSPRYPVGGEWSISGWPGTPRFKALGVRHGLHSCFSGYVLRTDAWFIVPDDPYLWHAVSRGDMQLCRVKRTKELHGYPNR